MTKILKSLRAKATLQRNEGKKNGSQKKERMHK